MTQIPSDDALLAATIDYLEAQLLPALEGEHRFKTRLAVNALKALQRSGLSTANRAAPKPNSRQLAIEPDHAQRLALKIANREVTQDDASALQQIEAMLRASLEINNPKWLSN
jgi:Domain of unknown function (DUF6285)